MLNLIQCKQKGIWLPAFAYLIIAEGSALSLLHRISNFRHLRIGNVVATMSQRTDIGLSEGNAIDTQLDFAQGNISDKSVFAHCFRNTIRRYGKTLEQLSFAVLRSISRSIDIDAHCLPVKLDTDIGLILRIFNVKNIEIPVH